MTTKHTPGPWKFHEADSYRDGGEITANPPYQTIRICEIPYWAATPEEMRANAALIAAAPETAAERDRLRAALEQATASLAVQAATARALAETSQQNLIANDRYASELERAVIVYKDVIANTSPAPVESVNKELLDALKIAVRALQDNDIDEVMAGEFEILTDAIAKAEKAGG